MARHAGPTMDRSATVNTVTVTPPKVSGSVADTGRIEKIVYRAGKFLNADLDKASEDNERNAFLISTPSARIGVVQIAGLIARRIVPFVKEMAFEMSTKLSDAVGRPCG